MSHKLIFVLALLAMSLSFAQEAELLKAKYGVAECYLNATVKLLDSVASCTVKNNVGVVDLSSYKTTIEADRTSLQTATTSYDFDNAWANAQTHMNQTVEAIKQSNATLSGTNISIGLARLCYAVELLKTTTTGAACVLIQGYASIAKMAILNFYDVSIIRADAILSGAKNGGLGTTKMEEALTYAKTLRSELVTALETKDQAKFKDIQLRYGRASIRFFDEYARSLADWAEPLVRVSNNYNKAEILTRISTIRTYISEVDSKCPATYSVSDTTSYGASNKACWETLKKVESECKAVIALYRSGVPIVLAGQGQVHASGTGNISLFGNASVNVTGSGDLYVNDFKGDSQVTVDVPGVRQPDGSMKYAGFTNAKIHGSIINVRTSGTIVFDASGNGIVRMQGDGTFTATPGLGTEGDYTKVN